MRRASAVMVVIAAGLLTVAGTGSAAPTVQSASVVKVSAVASGLAFNKKVLRARAGKVTIVFTNLSIVPHDLRLKRGAKRIGGTKTIGKGRTKAALRLKKGTYVFYCSVPGHEGAGMKGKLIVR